MYEEGKGGMMRCRGAEPWLIQPESKEDARTGFQQDMKACKEGLLDPVYCDPDTWEPAFHLQPFLQDAAEFLARSSCGEGFLLQPKIIEMPRSEYRLPALLPLLSSPP